MYNNSMAMNSDPGHLILVAWDMYGLEMCEDITQAEKNQLFDLIRGESNFESWLKNLIFYAMMRAHINSDRRYEVYTITLDSELSAENLVKTFEVNPQYIVNWIRKHGNPVYQASAGYRPQQIF